LPAIIECLKFPIPTPPPTKKNAPPIKPCVSIYQQTTKAVLSLFKHFLGSLAAHANMHCHKQKVPGQLKAVPTLGNIQFPN
jgi:hypothetical protein